VVVRLQVDWENDNHGKLKMNYYDFYNSIFEVIGARNVCVWYTCAVPSGNPSVGVIVRCRQLERHAGRE
jgi:hypothetical protein